MKNLFSQINRNLNDLCSLTFDSFKVTRFPLCQCSSGTPPGPYDSTRGQPLPGWSSLASLLTSTQMPPFRPCLYSSPLLKNVSYLAVTVKDKLESAKRYKSRRPRSKQPNNLAYWLLPCLRSTVCLRRTGLTFVLPFCIAESVKVLTLSIVPFLVKS